jgi:hypothetical protein
MVVTALGLFVAERFISQQDICLLVGYIAGNGTGTYLAIMISNRKNNKKGEIKN